MPYLGGGDVEKDAEEGEKKGPRIQFEVCHEVDDDEEDSGQRPLHGDVGQSATEEVGGELVHVGGTLLGQHRTLLGECEEGGEEREEAPEYGDEE